MYLTRNVLIETITTQIDPQTDRVLYISKDSNLIVTIDVKSLSSKPVIMSLSDVERQLEEGVSRILRHDSWLALPRNEDSLSDADREGRDRAWKIIRPIVDSGFDAYDRKSRGILVNEAHNRGAAHKTTIRRLLHRYWVGGQNIFALIPDYSNSGAPGKSRTGNAEASKKRGRKSGIQKSTDSDIGINVNENIRILLVKIGKEFLESSDQLTREQALKKGLDKYFHIGHDVLPDGKRIPILPPPEQLPTLAQFDYWYNKEKDHDKAISAREGKGKYKLRHRGFRGDSTSMAFGPGSIYQIDATIGDVYLVSSRDPRLIIGRPVIYVIVDVFTRMVTGFTVGLEGPSWMGAVSAFENVATDKVEFCQSLGISISPDIWPAHHFPEAVLADRGEMLSGNADSLVTGFGIRIANTPPYRPDWKGIVERRFRLINDRIVRWLPGAVRRAVRGDRDYRLDAAMTLAQLRKVLTYCFLEYNQHAIIKEYPRDADMVRLRVRANPLELWHWGIEHRSGGLKYFPPEIVRQGLLPRGTATMTPRGLRFGKEYFTSEYIESKNLRSLARQKGTWRESIAYDPWTAQNIWLEVKGERELIKCTQIQTISSSGNTPWAELELEYALDEFYRRRAEEERSKARTHYGTEIDQVLAEAKAYVNSVPNNASNNQRVKGIRENRRIEKEQERQNLREQKTASPSRSSPQSPTPPPSIPLFASSTSAVLDALVDEQEE